MGMDVYAMVGRRIVNHSLSLESLGITPNCTVSFFSRLRGGSRENVAGAVDVFKLLCGALLSGANHTLPVWCTSSCRLCSLGMTKKGKDPQRPPGSCSSEGTQLCAATTSNRPHVVPPRGGPPWAGVGDPPLPIPPKILDDFLFYRCCCNFFRQNPRRFP